MYFAHIINSAKLGKEYLIYCLSQICIITVLFTFIIIRSDQFVIVQVGEFFLTSIFFVELLVRILICKESFLQNFQNLIDLIVFTAIILIMITYQSLCISDSDKNQKYELLLLGIRYILQVIIIAIHLKKNRDMLQYIDENKITFDSTVSSQ
ncbi:hypothetical protein pb186bvf_012575 [Paramecium bursaria]